ncbi:MAG: plasmid pRiA4b ORF-3 family protein [Erysipelotrichaceae bacterium]|nr:plasmid pRiA4b ORF-3 family protein [Erysipelotrichaceae bacterium]
MDKIEIYEQNMTNKIWNSDNSEIQDNLNILKEKIPQDEWNYYITTAINEFTKLFESEDYDEPITDNDILNVIKMATQLYNVSTQSVVIRVILAGLGRQLYREMEIPYDITLADLAYLVLSSFKADGSHLFSVNYGKNRFSCRDSFYNENRADEIYLTQLYLQFNNQIDIEYDFGDEWLFKVTVKSILDHDGKFNLDDSRIIKGKGYGIWEDEHYLMNLYYKKHDAFLDYIDDISMSEDDFVTDEFDLEDANDDLLSDYEYFKSIYSEW